MQQHEYEYDSQEWLAEQKILLAQTIMADLEAERAYLKLLSEGEQPLQTDEF